MDSVLILTEHILLWIHFFFLLSQEYIYKKKNNIIEPQNKLVWNQENTKWKKKIEIKQLIDT